MNESSGQELFPPLGIPLLSMKKTYMGASVTGVVLAQALGFSFQQAIVQ